MKNSMDKIFVDTWGWLTMLNDKEKQHQKIGWLIREELQRGTQLVTSDAVLSETITLLFRRLPQEKAIQMLDVVAQQQGLQKISITPERFERAVDLRKQYADHPRISFTDFLSFIIMDEYGISSVLSEDHDFDIVHFGFQRIP